MEFNFTTQQIEEIVNWTLPGLTMYYRDAHLPEDVITKYKVGQIFRAGIFTDVSGFAGQLTKNSRFVIASSKAVPTYKVNPDNEKWQHHTLNVNSYFKVLDIYKKDGKTQFFLLHIPAQGVEFFRRTVLQLGGNNIEEQIIAKARQSLDTKMNMEPVRALEENAWIERTWFPVGMKDKDQFFSLYPDEKPTGQEAQLWSGLRNMIGDTSALNVPTLSADASVAPPGAIEVEHPIPAPPQQETETPPAQKGFWKRLFGG